jgi:hypothetical protein
MEPPERPVEPLYPDIPPAPARRKADMSQVLLGLGTLVLLVATVLLAATVVVWWWRTVIG